MKFSIIIPTYNNVELLKKCIGSIMKHTDLSETEIIVVANGCTDGTESYLFMLDNTTENLKVLWYKEPLGYTVATNKGIQAASGSYLVLLNNDTEFLDQEKGTWLNMLYEPFSKDKEVAITGCTKVSKPELLNKPFLIFFCVMINPKLTGLLDEVFNPGYGEDCDMCWKAEQHGYKVVQVPDQEPPETDGKQYLSRFPIWHVSTQTFKDVAEYPEVVKRNTKTIEERWGDKKTILEHDVTYKMGDLQDNKIKFNKGLISVNPGSDLDKIATAFSVPQSDHFDGFKDIEVPKREIGDIPEIDQPRFVQQRRFDMLTKKELDPMAILRPHKVGQERMRKAYWDAQPQNKTQLNIERAKTIDGFMLESELLVLAKLASTAKVFIEIGSWHGRSSAAIVDNLPEGSVLYCIDTWKGTEGENGAHRIAKDLGGDFSYYKFLSTHWADVQKGKIIPLRMSSMNAHYFLKDQQINADVIFIDGDHAYKEVQMDILWWEEHLNDNATLCGHDYVWDHPGVIKAVDEKFGKDVSIFPDTSIWKYEPKKKEEIVWEAEGFFKNQNDSITETMEDGTEFNYKPLGINKEIREFLTEEINKSTPIKITVGIPTRDRYDILANCLQSIIFQTYQAHEIIVVDDTENASNLQEKFPLYDYLIKTAVEKGIKFRVIYGKKLGPQYSHQTIQESAEGNWIFRIDDDCVMEPDGLQKLVAISSIGKVGAVAPLVLLPFAEPFTSGRNMIKYMGSTNVQWLKRVSEDDGRLFEAQDHLYSCFLYKKGIANYNLSLSKMGFREETLFSYRILRAGYDLRINPNAVVHHFRAKEGGIRPYEKDKVMYEHDEGTFRSLLSLWDANPDETKVVVLDGGIGDHWAFKHSLPMMIKIYKQVKIACCYPDVFFDIDKSKIEIISIGDAKQIFWGCIDEFDIYRRMFDWNWKENTVKAFRKLYLETLN